MQYLTIWDIILTPIYLLILIAIAKKMRNKRYPKGHPLRRYFLPGLYVKFGGAILIALIYQFYYKSGDTFNFFYHSKIINSALNHSGSTWLNLILSVPVDRAPDTYLYTSQMFWPVDSTEYTIAVIAAVLGLINGTTYLPIALLFSYFAFTGTWAMYRTFTDLYPKLHKQLAFAFLFIPSTVIWGSAIFKDTWCMFGLGWMTYTIFRLFIHKDYSFKNLSLLVLSFYVIAQIKLYILLAFIPALVFWLMLRYSRRIATTTLRWVISIFSIGLVIGGFLFFTQRFAKELNRYSLEKIAETAETTRGWTQYASGEEGSGYNIGKIDGSLGGTLSMLPQGVVVTLFRPFPWEVKKVIVGLSALESMILLYLTIKVFFNRKRKPFKFLFADPNALFCFVFSVIFAFAVGISSGNFGALSRYKIPCLPFYGAVLVILYYNNQGLNPKKTIMIKRNYETAI